MRVWLQRISDPGAAPWWVPFLIVILAIGAFALAGGMFPA